MSPKDTCTSIVYELECPVPNCKECYIGRTHEGMKECLKFITTNCDSNAKPLLEKHIKDKHMKGKHQDINLSEIKNWRMTEIASSCEDNKLKILESLHIKKAPVIKTVSTEHFAEQKAHCVSVHYEGAGSSEEMRK